MKRRGEWQGRSEDGCSPQMDRRDSCLGIPQLYGEGLDSGKVSNEVEEGEKGVWTNDERVFCSVGWYEWEEGNISVC